MSDVDIYYAVRGKYVIYKAYNLLVSEKGIDFILRVHMDHLRISTMVDNDIKPNQTNEQFSNKLYVYPYNCVQTNS